MRLSIRIHLLLALVIIAAAPGCRGATDPDLDLLMAKARWAAERPASYEMVVLRGCECMSQSIGPVTVEVLADGGVLKKYVHTGEAVPAPFADLFPTVDDLFDIIDDARRQQAFRLDAAYDPTFGYPTHVGIDYRERLADDEIFYGVSDFRAP